MESETSPWPHDDAAIRRIVEETTPRLYRFLHGMLGNAADAEDLLQETYAAALRRGKDFRGESSVLTWLTGIALNLARRKLRRRRIEKRFLLDMEILGPGRGTIPPDAAAADREQTEAVRRAVDALPDRERVVLTMFDWEGLSHREIAGILDCAEGTVWSLISRARADVRRRMEHDAGL